MSIVFPIHGAFDWKRVDKGQDFLTKPGTKLVAVVSGTLSAGSDPGGFGPRYPILHGDDGRSYYYGHVDLPAGLIGKHVKAGDVITRTLTTPRGNATQPGWLEFGDAALLGHGGETGGGAISVQLHAAAPKGGHSVGDIAKDFLFGAPADSLPQALDPLQGAAGDAAKSAANAAAGGIVDALASAFGIHASRILLYIVLVGGGIALAVAGLARTAGVTAGDVKKAAAIGAAA